jgi:hypothetical protein
VILRVGWCPARHQDALAVREPARSEDCQVRGVEASRLADADRKRAERRPGVVDDQGPAPVG